MYTLYKFHFLNGISEINQLFDDILIIWPASVHIKAFGNVNAFKVVLPAKGNSTQNLKVPYHLLTLMPSQMSSQVTFI